MKGQQCIGAGVDCVQFAAAVLDRLHGLPVERVQKYAHDAALHSPMEVARIAHYLAGRYPNEIVTDDDVEPGDIVVCRLTENSGPGHVMIIGWKPWTAWHSVTDESVRWTGVGCIREVFKIWRSKEKHLWRP